MYVFLQSQKESIQPTCIKQHETKRIRKIMSPATTKIDSYIFLLLYYCNRSEDPIKLDFFQFQNGNF